MVNAPSLWPTLLYLNPHSPFPFSLVRHFLQLRFEKVNDGMGVRPHPKIETCSLSVPALRMEHSDQCSFPHSFTSTHTQLSPIFPNTSSQLRFEKVNDGMGVRPHPKIETYSLSVPALRMDKTAAA